MKHQNSAVQGDFVNVSQNIDSPRGLILGNKVENLSCAVTSGVFCVTTSTMPGTKVKNAHVAQKADWAATLGSYVSTGVPQVSEYQKVNTARTAEVTTPKIKTARIAGDDQ